MKIKLIGLLFVCVLVLWASSACSSQDEPSRQLTAKDLAYTVWYRDKYIVEKRWSSEGGYYLRLSDTETITFADESKFIRTSDPVILSSGVVVYPGGSREGRYRIEKNMYFEDDTPHKITNYTGDKFEAIPTEEFSDEVARNSEFSYKMKYVFRKVKL